MAADNLTPERLRELLDYDPDTGIFTRKASATRRDRVGKVAGCREPSGRWRIRVEGVLHLAHRLAWLHFYGKWPQLDLDHFDCNPLNNRIANLREATKLLNAQNVRGTRIDSLTKTLGISKRKNKFMARM